MDRVGREIIIRRLRAEDADAIVDIYRFITKKAVNANLKGLIQEHAQENQHEAPYVAELNGLVVGFMISYIVTLGFGAEKSAYIATMGVHPRYMGQGIGAAIGREVVKFYKSLKITRIYTSVRWDSTDILSFFKTMDFERSPFINLKKDLNPLSEAVE